MTSFRKNTSARKVIIVVFPITVLSSSVPYKTKVCQIWADWPGCFFWNALCRLSVAGKSDYMRNLCTEL